MHKHMNHSLAVVKLILFVFRHDNPVRSLQRWRGARAPRHAVGRRSAGRRLPAHAASEPRRALPAARAPARVARALSLPPRAAAPRPHRGRRGRRPATRSATGTAASATTTATATAATTNLSRTYASGATAPEPDSVPASLAGPPGPHALLRTATRPAAAVHAVLQGSATGQPHARHGRLPATLPETKRWCAVPRRSSRPVRGTRPTPSTGYSPARAAEAAKAQPELRAPPVQVPNVRQRLQAEVDSAAARAHPH